MSLIPPGGKKQAWAKDGVQKIHTVFKDGSECLEEFDIKDQICVTRKWRKIDQLGRLGDWTWEIGEPGAQKSEVVTDMFQASNTPVVSRHDSEQFYLFKITNMPWPESNYMVTAEDDYLVVRTANKKFYKKLEISDLKWQKLPLIQNFIKFKAYNNTLIIFYQKPPAIIALERGAR